MGTAGNWAQGQRAITANKKYFMGKLENHQKIGSANPFEPPAFTREKLHH
jgi:hypothetical protein